MVSQKVAAGLLAVAIVGAGGSFLLYGNPGGQGASIYYSTPVSPAQTSVVTSAPVHLPSITVAANGAATAASVPGSTSLSGGSFIIPFTVTASNAAAFIPARTAFSTTASSSKKIQYSIDRGGVPVTATTTGTIVYTGTNNLHPDANGNYIISSGTTGSFALRLNYMPTTHGHYKVTLVNVPWSVIDATAWTGNNSTGYVSHAVSLSTPVLAL